MVRDNIYICFNWKICFNFMVICMGFIQSAFDYNAEFPKLCVKAKIEIHIRRFLQKNFDII